MYSTLISTIHFQDARIGELGAFRISIKSMFISRILYLPINKGLILASISLLFIFYIIKI